VTDPSHEYLESARREFRRLKQLADGAIAQLDEAGLFRPPREQENSVALLMKHLSGNMLSRWTDFLTTDGEKPDRERDREFELEAEDHREALLARWERGWACLFDTLSSLEPKDMSRTVAIRGETHTVLQAVQRQVAHYAYHTGQIVLLAKLRQGPEWRTLSIAKRQSDAFNRTPSSYLGEPN
jgi:hypothetical protein